MIFLIILFGLILRLINLNQSLWLDEAISVLTARDLTPIQIITQFSPGDVHPPGFYLIAWVFVHLFGSSEVSIRLISVIAAIFSIYFLYQLGARLFSKKVGLLAATIFSLNPLHIYYSQEARMYSLETLFVILSFYFFTSFKKGYSKIGYVISIIMIFYLDYLGYLVVAAQIIYLWLSKSDKKREILSLIFIALIFAVPVLVYLPAQIAKGQETALLLPSWSSVVGGLNAKQVLLVVAKTIIGRISFLNKITYFLIVFIATIVYGLLIYKAFRFKFKELKLVFCWFIFPFLGAISISFFIPVLAYHRLIFILPALFLLAAVGFFSFQSKIKYLLIFILGLISIVSIFIYYTNRNFQREDWRLATQKIEILEDSQTALLFEDNHLPPPFVYYSRNPSVAFGGLKNIPSKNDEDLNDLSKLNNKKRIYLFEYLFEINDPNKLLVSWIEKNGYTFVKTYNFSGVGFVTEYQKFW